MAIIEIKDLSKSFNGFEAVKKISLEINEGELFGLLGPNGAGKTTTISMLSTLLQPTSGSAVLCNHNIAHEKDEVRKCIGLVFQDPSLDIDLTGRENLDFHGRLYDMPKDKRQKRINEVLKLVDLEDKADKLVKTFSGGMKRRLEIARGLMHKPRVLFLDEPTIGLDPQTRRKLWEYIKNFNKKEKITIILTTHYLEEADFLCERIAIIDHGKIIALDTPENLKKVLGGDVITLDSTNPEKLKNILGKHDWLKSVSIIENKLNIVSDNGSTAIPKLIETANNNSITINSVTLKTPTLEDVFIHYTGRTIREETGSAKDNFRMHARIRGRR